MRSTKGTRLHEAWEAYHDAVENRGYAVRWIQHGRSCRTALSEIAEGQRKLGRAQALFDTVVPWPEQHQQPLSEKLATERRKYDGLTSALERQCFRRGG